MKLLHFFRKKEEKTEKLGRFADFFLNASSQEKKRVFTEAGHRANRDQLEIFERYQASLNPVK